MSGEVKVTLKVVDNLTKEGKQVLDKFGKEVKEAAKASKSFMETFDARAFGAVFKGMGKAINLFQQFGATLNKLAPDAKEFQAQFSQDTIAKLTKTAEAYNHLGASASAAFGRLVTAVGLTGLMDDIAARLSPKLEMSEGAKLQKAIEDAKEAARLGPSSANEKGSALRNEFDRLAKAVLDAEAALKKFNDEREATLRKNQEIAIQMEKDNEQRIRQRNAAQGIPELGGPAPDVQRFEDDPLNRAMREALAIRRATMAALDDGMIDTEAIRKHEELLQEIGDRNEQARIQEEQDNIQAFMERTEMELAFDEKKNAELIAANQARLDAETKALEEAMAEQEAIDAERFHEWEQLMALRQQEIEKWADMLTGNFMRFFDDVISGTESLGRAFTRMIGGMIADAGRMMATDAMKSIFSSLVGSFIGTPAQPGTSPGGGWDPMRNAHAGGGFVGAGRPYLVGERGPELFTPSSSGNISTNAQSGGGGIGNVSIVVNGAQDPTRTAVEVRRALMGLMSNDPGVRQRLRGVVA